MAIMQLYLQLFIALYLLTNYAATAFLRTSSVLPPAAFYPSSASLSSSSSSSSSSQIQDVFGKKILSSHNCCWIQRLQGVSAQTRGWKANPLLVTYAAAAAADDVDDENASDLNDNEEEVVPQQPVSPGPVGPSAVEPSRRDLIGQFQNRVRGAKMTANDGSNNGATKRPTAEEEAERAARLARRLAAEGTPGFGAGIPRINSVTMVGRLGQDPELRYFESGSCAVFNLNLAVTRQIVPLERRARGITYGSEPTDWWPLTIWGREAQYAAKVCKKGLRVGVQGQLACDKWIGPDGEQRKKFKIIVSKLTVLETREEILARQNEPEQNQPWKKKDTTPTTATTPSPTTPTTTTTTPSAFTSPPSNPTSTTTPSASPATPDNRYSPSSGDASINDRVRQLEQIADVVIERVQEPPRGGGDGKTAASVAASDWWTEMDNSHSGGSSAAAPPVTGTSTSTSTSSEDNADLDDNNDSGAKRKRRGRPRAVVDEDPLTFDDGDKPLPSFFNEF